MKTYYKKLGEPPPVFFDWTNVRGLLNNNQI